MLPYILDLSYLFVFIVRLRSDSNADRFRQFMIQGRARSDNSPVGTFGSSGNSQPQCANDVSITSIMLL